MKKVNYLNLATTFLLIFAFSCQTNHKTEKVIFQTTDELVAHFANGLEKISIEEFKTLMDNGESYILIDVRESQEHNKAYIPGSISIPRGVLEFRIANEQMKPIVVHVEQGKSECPDWILGRIPHQMIFSTWIQVADYFRYIAYDIEIDKMNRWYFFDFHGPQLR